MLDIQFIRDNRELVAQNALNKNRPVDIDKLLDVDEKRRKLLQEVEELQALRNDLNDLIQKAETEEERQEVIEKGKAIKQKLDELTPHLEGVQAEYMTLLRSVPNIASADTPVGKDDAENAVLREVGQKPELPFTPRAHDDIGRMLDLIDIESAAQVAGSRFTYLKGDLVLLQQALINYVFSTLTSEKTLAGIAGQAGLQVSSKPFVPVLPPVFIRPEILEKMDRLEPREDRYYLQEDDLFLVGSAEHTLGPLHMNQTLDEKSLPIRYIGYATSFRREAGSYGKDTKGIIRVHQFDKLEMESFTTEKDALNEQNFIVAIQEHMLQALELPYRVVQVCTGDMGKPNVRQVDMETWMASQGKYRETHSADYMGDYQARRLAIKVKKEDGHMEFVHMNDATAFALGRILAAILENYQEQDGSVRVPTILQAGVGNEILTKA